MEFDGKLFDGMYVNSLACVRVKWGESEQFMIDSGARQGCIMSSWLFNVYMDAVVKEVKKDWKGRELESCKRGENGDYFVSCMQMDWFCVMRAMVGHYV